MYRTLRNAVKKISLVLFPQPFVNMIHVQKSSPTEFALRHSPRQTASSNVFFSPLDQSTLISFPLNFQSLHRKDSLNFLIIITAVARILDNTSDVFPSKHTLMCNRLCPFHF